MIRKFNSRIIHTNLDIKSVGCLPFEVGRNVFMAVSASAAETRFQLHSHHGPVSLLGLRGPACSWALRPLGMRTRREEFVRTNAGGPPSELAGHAAIINGM